jgi:hypothetical protein
MVMSVFFLKGHKNRRNPERILFDVENVFPHLVLLIDFGFPILF